MGLCPEPHKVGCIAACLPLPVLGESEFPTSAVSAATAEASAAGAEAQKPLKLLLVAARHHMASADLRALLGFLNSEECTCKLTLQVADPADHPELLELHRLVATPALIKLGRASCRERV